MINKNYNYTHTVTKLISYKYTDIDGKVLKNIYGAKGFSMTTKDGVFSSLFVPSKELMQYWKDNKEKAVVGIATHKVTGKDYLMPTDEFYKQKGLI